MSGVPKRAPFVLLLLLLSACQGDGPTDPLEERGPRGRLAGVVTIGPNCPGPVTCPTPASAYAERKILVYEEPKGAVLSEVDIDSTGLYVIDLRPGKYNIELRGLANDRTDDLPKAVEIFPNVVTPLDVRIDTGIR
jgi:hypothetical protein